MPLDPDGHIPVVEYNSRSSTSTATITNTQQQQQQQQVLLQSNSNSNESAVVVNNNEGNRLQQPPTVTAVSYQPHVINSSSNNNDNNRMTSSQRSTNTTTDEQYALANTNSIRYSWSAEQQQQQAHQFVDGGLPQYKQQVNDIIPSQATIIHQYNNNRHSHNGSTRDSITTSSVDNTVTYSITQQTTNTIEGDNNNNNQQQHQQRPPIIATNVTLLPDSHINNDTTTTDNNNNDNFTHDNNDNNNNNNNEITTTTEDNTTIQTKTISDMMTAHSSSNSSNTQNEKRWKMLILGFISLLVLGGILGAILGLVVFKDNNNDDDSDIIVEPPIIDPIFDNIGGSLEGSAINFYLGTALAFSQSGHRLAVSSSNIIRVYESNVSDNMWKQLGEDIIIKHNNNNNNQRIDLQDEEIITIDMDAMGEYVVAGYGAGGDSGQGYVQVFRFVNFIWIPAGQYLNGIVYGDRFGSSVAMNNDGDVIAVGAPGGINGTGYVAVYQRDSNGSWGQRGDIIQGEISDYVSELGRSVSLSESGDRVAAGSKSSPGFGGTNNSNNGDNDTFFNVVSVYEYDRFGDLNWTQLGNGIPGVASSKSTGWYVNLDASGKRMAVSNTYLSESDFINADLRALVVQAYEFNNEKWQNFGERLHGNITGSKSGYVISYSDDGLTMAMGDRGTSEGGRSRGHAHIYKYINNAWAQQGPDVEGVADGDNFGFSVAISGDGTRFAAGAPYSRAAFSDGGQVKSFSLI